MFDTEYDVVVIGGGINGLTVAAYLAKAGAKVAVIERRHLIGTHCSTEELSLPGVRHNLHASALVPSFGPCIEDLDLEMYGLELIGGNWNFLHPFEDGRAMLLHSYDPNIAYNNVKRFSEKDAKSYKKFVNALNKHIVEIAWHLYMPPSMQEEERFTKLMSKIPEVPDIYDMTGYELMDELFEEDHVKTVFASMALAIYGRASQKYSGTFGVLSSLIASSGVECSMTARGGSSNLPRSLERCILSHSGSILTNCEVEKIVVKDGEAKGVRLSEKSNNPGAEIGAKLAVVSNLTAVPTFLQLVGEDHMDRSIIKSLNNFDYGGQTLFTAVYATNDILRWSSRKWDPNVEDAYWFHYGAETVKELRDHEDDTDKGIVTDPIVAVGGSFLFTKRDPTQAPPGMHNITTWVNVPYNVRANTWDKMKFDIADKITERIDGYAPGFKKTIIRSEAYSPLDIERRNPSAVNANFQGGNSKIGQVYMDRPFPGCGAPRTPIRKLYISNSIWPTSGSHLCTGYIAACAVAEDLGIRNQPWWNHEPLAWFRQWVGQHSGRNWSPFVSVD